MRSDASYSFVELLKSSDNLSELIEAQVAKTAQQLGLNLDPVNLAGACLGTPLDAVDRLNLTGLLPDGLPIESQNNLRELLDCGSGDLRRAIFENRAQVAEFLELPVPRKENKIQIPITSIPGYSLFPHQRRALQRMRDLLDKGRERMVLHMPTGGGKTRTGMNLICDCLRRSDQGAVLWLASTKELLGQAASEFARAWSHLGNRELPIHTAFGGRDWPLDLEDGLLVASPQTLYQLMQTQGVSAIGELGRRLQLIVFDEAHQAIASTYSDVTERLSFAGNPTSPIVGLTATPGRTFMGDDDDDLLAKFFQNTKIMLDTAAEGGSTNPVEYLIENGYLANPEFILLGEVPENDEHDFKHDIEDTVEVGVPVDKYLEIVTKATLDLAEEGHKRILVFAASVELSKTLSAILRVGGLNAQSIDSGTESDARDTVIREYCTRTNDPRVLVNYGVLTTGFDAPQTSAAVIARPTRSLVLYSQMVGRAIRGVKAGGNENAKVVTVIDPSVPSFGSIATAFTHWDDYWESENANGKSAV